MTYQITQFAADESASGLGALGIDGKAFLIQLITFVLAYVVLRRFAFKPILKVLDERRETIESGVKLGEEMRVERAKLTDEIEAQLRTARTQADSIISDATESGRQVVREAEDKAREKAEGILTEAQARIAQDTKRARKQLEQEVVGLISDATEAIIGEKIDAKKDASLIDKALKNKVAA